MATALYVTLGPVAYIEAGKVRHITKAGVQVRLDQAQAAALGDLISYVRSGLQVSDLPRVVTLKYPSRSEFPINGDSNCLYLAEATGLLYSWDETSREYETVSQNGITSDGIGDATPIGRALLTAATEDSARGVINVPSMEQHDSKQTVAERGQANGYASLDGGGKVPANQLPASVMTYQGVWNAATNSPVLANGAGDIGDVYRVGTAGSRNLGSGSITFDVGDYVIYNGVAWEKSDTTDAVASVAGLKGDISAASLQAALGVDNKVAKVATAGSVYGTADVTYPISSGTANPNSLPYRDAGGTFRVGEPTHPAHPSSRGYVDTITNFIIGSGDNWVLDPLVVDPVFWSGVYPGWSLSTDFALSGTQSMKFVRETSFGLLTTVKTPAGAGLRMPVRSGDTISMSTWVYFPSAIAAGSVYYGIQFTDSGSVNAPLTLSSPTIPNASIAPGVWTEVLGSIVAPAGYDSATIIRFGPTSGTPTGAIFYADNFLVFRSDSNKADKTYVDSKIKEQIRPGGYLPNFYYFCDYSKTVATTFSADRLRLTPFIVTHPVSIASLFVDVTGAAAGSNVLATIYDDDGSGKPLNRKCWATISMAATGVIDVSVGTPVVLQPGLYWAGGVMRGTNVPTLRCISDPSLKIQLPSPGNAGVLPLSGDVPQHWALATVSGDPPTVLGSGLFTANTNVPRIGFKVAA